MDWLAGGDRREMAAERIYAAAADAVAARGLDRLSIDDLAARVGCSRATIYRHVGGKRELRDGVLARSISRIDAQVAAAVADLEGPERVARAILVALDTVRNDAVAMTMLDSAPNAENVNQSLTRSPLLAAAAAKLTGQDDADQVALEWIVRVVLALLYWPMSEPGAEEAIVRRFVAGPMTTRS